MVLRALSARDGRGVGVGASAGDGKAPRDARIAQLFLQPGYRRAYLLRRSATFFLYDRIGWRPLFFIGGLAGVLAVFVACG